MKQDQTGHVHSESLRVHPALSMMQQFPYPLRGAITAVWWRDVDKNQTDQTLVDIDLFGGHSCLKNVPIAVPKANRTTGEEWSPEPGDNVIVQFINGRWTDPIVTGWVHLPGNLIQAEKEDLPTGTRRYHFRCNETDVTVDKDGNRDTYISENERIVVNENCDLTIENGNYTIKVNSGNLEITVNTGNANITVQGNTTISTTGDSKISTYGNSEINTTGNSEINTTGTAHIQSNDTMTVTTSADLNINATDKINITSAAACNVIANDVLDIITMGDATVTCSGKATIQSKGTVELDGGGGDMVLTGVVTQKCICPFTGLPHSDYSTDVKATKS